MGTAAGLNFEPSRGARAILQASSCLLCLLGVKAYKHKHSKLPPKKQMYIVRFKMVFGCNSVSEMEVSMVLAGGKEDAQILQ